MGAFAAAGLAASESLAAATMHGDLNSSVSSLATAAYHTQDAGADRARCGGRRQRASTRWRR